MPLEATQEAFVLHRGNLSDPYSKDAWSKITIKTMDPSHARQLLDKVHTKPVDVAAQLSKFKCGNARTKIQQAVNERQTYEGMGSGFKWIVVFLEAHTKQKTVKSKRSAYQVDVLTYTASIGVILARVPSSPSPYSPFQVPQGDSSAHLATQYLPYQGAPPKKGASPPPYRPATPVQQKRRHGHGHKAHKDDSDTSDSDSIFSHDYDSGDTPSTKPSSDKKESRGRSLDRKKEPESRHGSPGRRPRKQRQKSIVHQDEIDKLVERKVVETLKQERAEEERKRKEREQSEKEARQDKEMQYLQRELAALKARDRRDDYDGRVRDDYLGRRRYGGPEYYY